MPTSLDFAYAAGLIDGDGCFSLKLHLYKNRQSFNPGLCVAMTDAQVPLWFEETFGGAVSACRGTGKADDHYTWNLNHRTALEPLLQGVIPFLKTKQLCAIILAEFYVKFPKYERFSKEKEIEMLKYRSYLDILNAKGKGAAARKRQFIEIYTGKILYTPALPLRLDVNTLLAEINNDSLGN